MSSSEEPEGSRETFQDDSDNTFNQHVFQGFKELYDFTRQSFPDIPDF